jgi:hypothetical protein
MILNVQNSSEDGECLHHFFWILIPFFLLVSAFQILVTCYLSNSYVQIWDCNNPLDEGNSSLLSLKEFLKFKRF